MGIILNTETKDTVNINGLRDVAETMDSITKALILTLLNSKEEKKRKDGEILKKEYFKNVLDKSLEEICAKEDENKLIHRLRMEELDLEIQERRVKKIKEILAKKEVKNG